MEYLDKIKSFEDLVVWKKSMVLTKEVYLLTRTFPDDERFLLTNQIRRAVISIPSNIAEGFGRHSDKDYLHFLYISRGSLYELKTQLYIARALAYLPTKKNKVDELLLEVGKLLNGTIRKIKDGLDYNLCD
ncbi:four helix bundle protein [Capnocytophaga leadbetteri]